MDAAETELLNLFIKTCHTVRDPRNRRSRIELVIPAAEWEKKFHARLDEIKQGNSRRQPGTTTERG